MKQLNIFTGQNKEEISIEFIKDNEPEGGYMLCYSGGKDSIVLEDIARKSGVSYSVFYSLMPDLPDIIKFIKKRPFHINILKPEINFWNGIVKNFPPHRKAAWCCSVIKEKPSKSIPIKHRLLGIRAEEGKRYKLGRINKLNKNQINYHPLFDWLEWEIWDYIEENNLEYCKLYDEGFSRLGCIVCPKRSKKDQEFIFNKYPHYRKLFEKQVEKWWNKKGYHRQRIRGYNYFLEEFLNNWYQGK